MRAKVQPAQLSFLAIYNPSLGPSDESFPDQLVYWYSRKYHDRRAAAKKSGRDDNAGGDAAREEENEKLRQIGLAQGMVDFARSFSNGEPVDAIETEKSRIVLQQVEEGWWILASIDLTRLPSIAPATPEPSKKGADKSEAQRNIEYSSREVSPASLLTQQLLQAHYIFLLHHGTSLSDLFVRLSRDRFCSTLDRFWTRFCKTWDVLLHANPAADIFSGLKLASGGELGFGVGEEEWGCGERDVLEDLTRRTEGLIDLVVSRFGEPAQAEASHHAHLPDSEALPWMGSGSQPAASDGVVFTGVGAVGRPSLRNVSLWMRQIYTYGEYAYGVRDNPLRERRKRRRRNPPTDAPHPANGTANASALEPKGVGDIDPTNLSKRIRQKAAAEAQGDQDEEGHAPDVALPKDPRPQIHSRVASHDHAAPSAAHTPELPLADRPGIPPPIVSAAEQALDKATKQADANDEAEKLEDRKEADAAGGSTWVVPDQYMKYLTFGLSELGKGSSSEKPKRPTPAKRSSTASTIKASKTAKNPGTKSAKEADADHAEEDASAVMSHLDPMPEHASLKAKFALQKRQENRGHFVIGLKGDLDAIPDNEDEDDADATDGSFGLDAGGSRIVLRTLQVEVLPKSSHTGDDEDPESEEETIDQLLTRKGSDAETTESAGTTNLKRVRVLVYVHRPFIYCFLFEDRTSSLSYNAFYRDLHRNLSAIHRPLLGSTNVAKVAQRIEASHSESTAETASIAESVRTGSSNRLPAKGGASASDTRPILDLIYDPRLLTVHTSIPNIPEPGTMAAEGLTSVGSNGGVPPGWSRIEALNVHSTVLNTLASVKPSRNAGRGEYERTCKTSRGWWVIWMRFPSSDTPITQAPAATQSDATAEETENGAGNGKGEARASSTATLQSGSTLEEKETPLSGHGEDAPSGSSSSIVPSTQLHDINLREDETDAVRTAVTPPKSRAATTHAASSVKPKADMSRIAFLVRRSTESTNTSSKYSSSSARQPSSMSGMWSAMGLRGGLMGLGGVSEEEKMGGFEAGWGPAESESGAKGVLAGGMGVDARRYVEGLLSLNR